LSYGCFEAGKASHEKREVKEHNAHKERPKSGIAPPPPRLWRASCKKAQNLEAGHKDREVMRRANSRIRIAAKDRKDRKETEDELVSACTRAFQN
jgi:hypothetical protein